eukprot:6203902-Pleurochrysis_carterae.AAC.1
MPRHKQVRRSKPDATPLPEGLRATQTVSESETVGHVLSFNFAASLIDTFRARAIRHACRVSHPHGFLVHVSSQVRIARETIEIFVPLARRLGISQLEYELLHHSVEYLFPQELLGLFGLELLGHWARLQCWGVLDDFLVRDQVLSELDVNTQLSSHRERWVQHVNYWGVAFAK